MRCGGMKGQQCFRVSGIVWPPFVQRAPDGTVTGVITEIFKILAEKAGYCYNVYLYPPNVTHGLSSVLDVANGVYDISVGPVTQVIENYKFVDYLESVRHGSFQIMYPRPGRQLQTMGLFMPFQLSVGIATLTALVSTSLALVAGYEIKRLRESDTQARTMSNIMKRIFEAYASLVGQPVAAVPPGLYLRVTIVIWLCFCFILGEIFTSNLKAMIIMPQVKVPFDSLAELVEQSEIPWTYMLDSGLDRVSKVAAKEEPDSNLGKLHLKRKKERIQDLPGIEDYLYANNIAGIFVKGSISLRLSADFRKHKKCRFAVAREDILPATANCYINKKLKDIKNKFNEIDKEFRQIIETSLRLVRDYILNSWKVGSLTSSSNVRCDSAPLIPRS